MRDPAPRFDNLAAIEDTCRLLERHMPWRTDADSYADGLASDMRVAAAEVEASNLPDWVKNFAVVAMLKRQNEEAPGQAEALRPQPCNPKSGN